MNRFYLSLLVVAVGFTFVEQSAQCQVTVDKIIHTFTHESARFQNVTVKNGSDKVLWINVIATEVKNPGGKEETRTVTRDLIGAPKRFKLESGSSRMVRLLLRTPAHDMEKVFRVRFDPHPEDFSNKNTTNGQVKEDTRTKVNVVFTMGMLLFAEPRNKRTSLKHTRKGNTITFTNQGNSNILLTDLKVCQTREDVKKDNCKSIDGTRVYPNNSWSVTVPSHSYLFLTRQSGETDFEQILVNP